MWLKNKVYGILLRAVRHPFLYPKVFKVVLKLTHLLGIGTFDILEVKYGHAKSHRLWQSINTNNEPIPWITYPAIEYLNQLDFRDKRIFEYGSGNSSLYWRERAKNIISIEHNLEWYNNLKHFEKSNHKLIFTPDTKDYVQSITKQGGLFDVIIIDGIERLACAQKSVDFLAPNGMIIFDNSDWYPTTCAFLRTMDLIQIDFYGFSPINQYILTTSLFLRRQFDFRPIKNVQPSHAIGSLNHKRD